MFKLIFKIILLNLYFLFHFSCQRIDEEIWKVKSNKIYNIEDNKEITGILVNKNNNISFISYNYDSKNYILNLKKKSEIYECENFTHLNFMSININNKIFLCGKSKYIYYINSSNSIDKIQISNNDYNENICFLNGNNLIILSKGSEGLTILDTKNLKSKKDTFQLSYYYDLFTEDNSNYYLLGKKNNKIILIIFIERNLNLNKISIKNLPVSLYNESKILMEDNLYFILTYIKNTSKFLYFILNEQFTIEFIGDQLSTFLLFENSRFFEISFFENPKYIYFLIAKNNNKYIGVYNIFSNVLIFNIKVQENTNLIYHIPDEYYIFEKNMLFYNNKSIIYKICPFVQDKKGNCIYSENMIIKKTGNKNLTNKCLNLKYNNYCVEKCPEGYTSNYYNQCYKICDDGKYHLNSKKCVSNCEDNEILINKYYCVSCDDYEKFKSIDSRFCIDSCEEIYNKFYIEKKQCIKKCKIGSYFDKEKNKCINCKEEKKFLDESNFQCIEKCPNNIYDENNICFDCFDRGLYSYERTDENNNTIIECLNSCSEKNLILINNSCIECRKGEYYLNENEKKNGGKCVKNCPNNYEEILNVCKKCSDYNNNKNKCINFKEDQINCNIGNEINFELKTCINCSLINKTYSNGSCIDNCDVYQIRENDICLDCVNYDNKKFFNESNCIKKCPKESVPYGFICDYCSRSNKKYFKGKCLDQCPDYTFEIDNICEICSDLNPNIPYLYYENNTKQCKEKCNETEELISDGYKLECLFCEKKIYDNKCVNECPEHTIFNDSESKKCKNCPIEKVFYENKCIDECYQGSIKSYDLKQISFCHNCEYGFYQNQCVGSCPISTYEIDVVRNKTSICRKCLCNINGGFCKKKKEKDILDYDCVCNKEFIGSMCHIKYNTTEKKDFKIFPYTRFLPSSQNDIGFTYSYPEKENIKTISWNGTFNFCNGVFPNEKEDLYITGFNDDKFIISKKYFIHQCNYKINCRIELKNGKKFYDELIIYVFNNDVFVDSFFYYYKYNKSKDIYCPIKDNITVDIKLKFGNSSENYSFQFLYYMNESEKKYFEFSKEFYIGQAPNQIFAPGKFLALKIIRKDGFFSINTDGKMPLYIGQIINSSFNIRDILTNKEENIFNKTGKLLYLFYYEELKQQDYNLHINFNDMNLLSSFLIETFEDLLKIEIIDNENYINFNYETNKENMFKNLLNYNKDNFYLIKVNSIQGIIRYMLLYLSEKQEELLDNGIKILSETVNILSKYKLDSQDFIYTYIIDTYRLILFKILNKNQTDETKKIFKIILSDLIKLNAIIMKSMDLNELFEINEPNTNMKIYFHRFGKNQNVISFKNNSNYIRDSETCTDDKFLDFCIQKNEFYGIIKEIKQFENKNKTNIGISLIFIDNSKNYLDNVLNQTMMNYFKNNSLKIISKSFVYPNLLLNDSFNSYSTKKHFNYTITFRHNENFIQKNTFCVPIEYLGKYDKNNYCKTYFDINNSKEKSKSDIKMNGTIICECNSFTQIGIIEGQIFSNFYKELQFGKNKNSKLLSHIIIFSFIGIISFFSIILLIYDIKDEKTFEKINLMNQYQKVKYYYSKISYLNNANVLSFSWYLFYFYCPFCHIFNIYSMKIPRHNRFMIEIIKILITLILSIYKYSNKVFIEKIKLINERNYNDKNISIHSYPSDINSQIINFLIAFFIYLLISIIFDFICNFLGYHEINDEKFKPMNFLISKFTYNRVKLDPLLNEKGKKLRLRILALSKICGENIVNNLKRKDKLSNYLFSQNTSINDSSELSDFKNHSFIKQMREPLLDKSENILNENVNLNNQTNIISKSKKTISKNNKYSEIFQRYYKIYLNKQKGKTYDLQNDYFIKKENSGFEYKHFNRRIQQCLNIFLNLILIFIIFMLEGIMKTLVEEVYEEYENNIIFTWLIPTLFLIVFYNFFFNYIFCLIISYIFFKSYYRTSSKIKKWFIKRLIKKYKYLYKIMLLITNNKSDIECTIETLSLDPINID